MPLAGLPPGAPIDRGRAGRLHVSIPVLGHLLRLPEGHEVVSARVTDFGDVELVVQGGDMPPHSAGDALAPVTLLCHVQMRPAENGGEEQRTIVNWQHAPEKQWTLFDWSPR